MDLWAFFAVLDHFKTAILDSPFNVSMIHLYCSLYKEEEGGVMQPMEVHQHE